MRRRADDRLGSERQARVVSLSVYQDDITVIAIGENAAADAEEGITRICEGRYGIELSRKDEASKPFAQYLSSIGATYNLEDSKNIICRPNAKREEKYRAVADELNKQAGKLIPLEDLERFIGLHQFMARFLEDGQQLCNSAYACLRAGYEITTSRRLAPYSKHFRADVWRVLYRLKEGIFPPISRDPILMHTGQMGACPDASGGCIEDGRGWGVCVMGEMAAGEWSAAVQEALRQGAISISPLELLGSAIALDVGYKAGKLPRGKAVILRNDNESACDVGNSGRAWCAPMREALNLFTKVKQSIGIAVRLQHLKGEANLISDYLSRGRTRAATMAASELCIPQWYEAPK